MALKESLFDRRTVQRHRRDGLVTDEQIKDHLKKLPDCADKAETLGSEPLPEAPPSKGKGR
jgi:hypothetical protein